MRKERGDGRGKRSELPGCLGQKEEQVGSLVGLHGPKGARDGLGRIFFFFKTFSFKTLSKFKHFSNFSNFKLYSKFLKLNLKTFKTSHKQT
jgi:hypothetical protein